MTDAIRTPDELLTGLPEFPFESHYRDWDGLRLAHLDLGEGRPVLFIHGEPTWSYLWRKVIPVVRDAGHRVIAPDLPGFGQTKTPPRGRFEYSFDNLAAVIGGFVETLGLTSYALYIFDYGAPTGLRLAVQHPERVTALVTQNGNAYLDGFSEAWEPWQTSGASRARPIARPAGTRCPTRRSASSTSMARRPICSRPTRCCSIPSTCTGRRPRKSSST